MSAAEKPAPSASMLRNVGRGLVLTGLAIWEALLLLWVALSVTLVVVWVGVLLVPGALDAVRSDARRQRRLALAWSGVHVVQRYQPLEPPWPPQSGLAARCRRALAMLGDLATWKDLLWHLVNPLVGPLLAFIPALAVLHGIWGILLLWLWEPVVQSWDSSWYLFVPLTSQATAVVAAVLGVLEIVAGLFVARPLLGVHGRWVATMLSGVSTAELQHRVDHLSETRSDVVSSQAQELRRIERDLHDGAQARLVAMGMTLTAVERLIDENPQAARAMVAEAKQTSSQALRELRALVRGIHPPVLADRGLVDAIRALAVESPLRVEVRSSVQGRPLPPLESAVYFAVSEVLTNVAKHAEADAVSIEVSHDGEHLQVVMQDDGKGGADPRSGTGLRGLERRLAAFDGLLTLRSPVGGPTTVNIDVPCHFTDEVGQPKRPEM